MISGPAQPPRGDPAAQEDEDESDRPTLIPAFDVSDYAKQSNSEIEALAPAPPRDQAPAPARHQALNVLLVDGDRIGRAAIARSLLRAQCQMVAAATLDELDEALGGGAPFEMALVNMDTAGGHSMLATIASTAPDLLIVVMSADDARARAALAEAGAQRSSVCKRDASVQDLLGMVRSR